MPATTRERVSTGRRASGEATAIVVALDGSAGAERALRLVRSVAWPAGTRIRLVSVLEELTPIVSGLPRTEEEEATRAALDAALADKATGVAGACFERGVGYGRPASE
ncbi:MAG TPA: universal stress protein, partial [Candidatus Limnocylindria bacterium]|nr:universal stress protein [Candidatus Limnocylindria bacterium]